MRRRAPWSLPETEVAAAPSRQGSAASSASRPRAGSSAIIGVTPPFRLDHTVAVLQRVPTNIVEIWTGGGRYLRAFETSGGPVAWEVAQDEGTSVRLRLHGPAGATDPWKALLRRMLGTEVDLGPFYAASAAIPVLASLADRFRGLKPPRFASLWESLVNTIAFQQLSLASGMASVARLVRRCALPVTLGAVELHPFPGAAAVHGLSDRDFRACWFSSAKARSLRAAAGAILDGTLREDELERLPDGEVIARLSQIPGVGPWTSSLVLLRGMGRVGTFPAGDAGADRRLRAVFGPIDPGPLLARLGEWKGMLYYHLLLSARSGV